LFVVIQPTKAADRGWVVNPFASNPWWCVFAAVPPSLLAMILIFMDQQITAVIVNRKENKLRVSANDYVHGGPVGVSKRRLVRDGCHEVKQVSHAL